MAEAEAQIHRTFEIQVLGRTLEHLGTQMYKRRDVALTELVANAWDAGATQIEILVPVGKGYTQATSVVSVTDNGSGMTADQVDDEYLVIGRNRRAEGQSAPANRRVMGRKGVGKLAGFGLGRVMTVLTWRDGAATEFALDGKELKAEGGESKRLEIPGVITSVPEDISFPSGTRVVMTQLKHKTPPDVDGLHRSLARRFSRTVKGSMAIRINGELLREPALSLELRWPEEGDESSTLDEVPEVALGDTEEVTSEDPAPQEVQEPSPPATDGDETTDGGADLGNPTVTWWAGFSKTVLPADLQGFTILVNGKTAQAPPFFFGVEGTASGQHGTKYLTGVIEADYLDEGEDDDSDRISTDRQEVDWEDEAAVPLRQWGDALTRRLLRVRSALREKKAEEAVNDVPELRDRIANLDGPSRSQANKFIRALGKAETSPERLVPLADTIVRAFEYRQFHDYIEELDKAMEEPDQFHAALEHLQGWKVLESRAILEVVQGRINIVDKFFSMIINDAAETAHRQGDDNLHDLVARYPWLINPEWQVLAEEKTITKQLAEWGEKEPPETDNTRYDFIGLVGDGRTVVIEIKRGAHPATVTDLQQLERYVDKLSVGPRVTRGAFVAGSYSMREERLRNWRERDDIDLFTWGEIHERTASYYRHYKAILDHELGNGDFDRKAREVAMTRTVLEGTSWRTKAERAAGIAEQDVSYAATTVQPGDPSKAPTASSSTSDAGSNPGGEDESKREPLLAGETANPIEPEDGLQPDEAG